MSAVHVEGVRRHCRAALWQTCIRDAAAVIALACAAFLAPWGTAITLGAVLLVIMVVGRVRLSSPLVLAVVLGVMLALVSDGIRERASFEAPLICLGVFFLIYMADILWSVRQVRKVWRDPALGRSGASPSADRAVPPRETGEAPASGGGGPGGSHEGSAVVRPRQVYYDKGGIVGAGTPFTPLPLTVPLDKRKDKAEDIDEFTAAALLAHIAGHIFTQGAGDGQMHGYAHGPLSEGDGRAPGDARILRTVCRTWMWA